MLTEKPREELERGLAEYLDRLYGDIPVASDEIRRQLFQQLASKGYGPDSFAEISDAEFVGECWGVFANKLRMGSQYYVNVLQFLWDFIPEDPGLTVDVCCGDMPIFGFLHRAGVLNGDLVGVEPFPNLHPSTRELPIVVAWPTALPLKDESAGCVVCLDTFQLCKDWEEVLAEMRRIAVRGARIAVSFPEYYRTSANAFSVSREMVDLGIEPVRCLGSAENCEGGVFVAGTVM